MGMYVLLMIEQPQQHLQDLNKTWEVVTGNDLMIG
jgi:hypothetical protein